MGEQNKAAILNVLKSDRIVDDDDDENFGNSRGMTADAALDDDTGIAKQGNDIEISDDDAPDLEDAKAKLRQ